MSRIGQSQLDDIVQLLREAASAEIMPRFRRLDAGAVRDKGVNDLVTDADLMAEAHITRGLQKMFPGCVVVGEEASAADPGLPARLADADLAFVVDPVDGTANYAMGLPLFGTMLAAVEQGAVTASVILDPLCDDSAVALRGQGAWIAFPDGRRQELHVAKPVQLADMSGMASWRFMPEPLRSTVAANMVRVRQSWDFRCAAHQYRLLAAGQCDFLVFHRLMPWDHLPGWLLHREAGGYAARFDGSEYRPGQSQGGLICAADKSCWEALRHELIGTASS